MSYSPKTVNLTNQKYYRIIPSVYPAINFFEELVDPAEMEMLWEIESLTNDRLRQQTGDIYLVPPEDRVCGLGSSVVMAAFTHIYRPSRFTEGSFGIYYASLSKETAIKETVYHRERFLRSTKEEGFELTMRLYQGHLTKPLYDIRDKHFKKFHHPEEYSASQEFGLMLKKQSAWGIIYNSVRDKGGLCIAALRPPAVSIPQQVSHLKYIWNGEKITEVLDTKSILKF